MVVHLHFFVCSIIVRCWCVRTQGRSGEGEGFPLERLSFGAFAGSGHGQNLGQARFSLRLVQSLLRSLSQLLVANRPTGVHVLRTY